MAKILRRNTGVDWTRAVEDTTPAGQINLEKIFREEWNKENGKERWINRGLGIAQLLMVIGERAAKQFDGPNQDRLQCSIFNSAYSDSDVCVYDLTEREQRIIATIIQWLGTNVGFSFLCRCLKKAGYAVRDVRRISPPTKTPKPVEVLKLEGRFKILRDS